MQMTDPFASMRTFKKRSLTSVSFVTRGFRCLMATLRGVTNYQTLKEFLAFVTTAFKFPMGVAFISERKQKRAF